jgi:hypothetical protein
MTVEELIRAFAETSATAICLTGRPGPKTRYVSSRFFVVRGVAIEEIGARFGGQVGAA